MDLAELSTREAHQMARRLFLIQTLLNYRTMQGGGYLFALWPWLRKQDERKTKVEAAAGYINSHPVFASFAVGAMRKRLAEHPFNPPTEVGGDEFAQWRESLAGPLGVTGDALIWDRWKPLVFATAALILLLASSSTAWALVAIAALIVYNAPLYALRVWGIREGYRLGVRVLDALTHKRFTQMRRVMTFAGIWLAGALAGLGIWSAAQQSPGRGGQFIIAFIVMWFGLRFRLSASTAVLFAVLAALIVPGLS